MRKLLSMLAALALALTGLVVVDSSPAFANPGCFAHFITSSTLETADDGWRVYQSPVYVVQGGAYAGCTVIQIGHQDNGKYRVVNAVHGGLIGGWITSAGGGNNPYITLISMPGGASVGFTFAVQKQAGLGSIPSSTIVQD